MIVDTNTGRYIALNRTAAITLKALIEHQDVDETLSSIERLIDADRATLRTDIRSLVSQLKDLGLVLEEGTSRS